MKTNDLAVDPAGGAWRQHNIHWLPARFSSIIGRPRLGADFNRTNNQEI
ncbi:hypothetical protein [Aeromonas dhakensis]|nr:hypothetical protein [Aeromonas dhakensis]WAF68097.1 hypothetical protein NRK98_19720 [Aeromonas dhakensis]